MSVGKILKAGYVLKLEEDWYATKWKRRYALLLQTKRKRGMLTFYDKALDDKDHQKKAALLVKIVEKNVFKRKGVVLQISTSAGECRSSSKGREGSEDSAESTAVYFDSEHEKLPLSPDRRAVMKKRRSPSAMSSSSFSGESLLLPPLEGFLEKRSDHFKTWRKRYVRLVGRSLAYDDLKSSGETKGNWTINETCTVTKMAGNESLGFVLTLGDKYRVFWQAESKESADKWFRALDIRTKLRAKTSRPSVRHSRRTAGGNGNKSAAEIAVQEVDGDGDEDTMRCTGTIVLEIQKSEEADAWVDAIKVFLVGTNRRLAAQRRYSRRYSSTGSLAIPPSPRSGSDASLLSAPATPSTPFPESPSPSNLSAAGSIESPVHMRVKKSAGIRASASKLQGRALTAFELLQTERKYCTDLQMALEVYQSPMLEQSDHATSKKSKRKSKRLRPLSSRFSGLFRGGGSSSSLSAAFPGKYSDIFFRGSDIRAIFGNMENILRFNKEFLAELEDTMPSHVKTAQDLYKSTEAVITETCDRISNVFVKLTPFLLLYQGYAQNYDRALATLRRLRKEDPIVTDWLEDQRDRSNHEDVDSFLIKPVQRLLRYKLLLRDIVRGTDEAHADYDSLQLAIQKLDIVANKVNASTGSSQRETIEGTGYNRDSISKLSSSRNIMSLQSPVSPPVRGRSASTYVSRRPSALRGAVLMKAAQNEGSQSARAVLSVGEPRKNAAMAEGKLNGRRRKFSSFDGVRVYAEDTDEEMNEEKERNNDKIDNNSSVSSPKKIEAKRGLDTETPPDTCGPSLPFYTPGKAAKSALHSRDGSKMSLHTSPAPVRLSVEPSQRLSTDSSAISTTAHPLSPTSATRKHSKRATRVLRDRLEKPDDPSLWLQPLFKKATSEQDLVHDAPSRLATVDEEPHDVTSSKANEDDAAIALQRRESVSERYSDKLDIDIGAGTISSALCRSHLQRGAEKFEVPPGLRRIENEEEESRALERAGSFGPTRAKAADSFGPARGSRRSVPQRESERVDIDSGVMRIRRDAQEESKAMKRCGSFGPGLSMPANRYDDVMAFAKSLPDVENAMSRDVTTLYDPIRTIDDASLHPDRAFPVRDYLPSVKSSVVDDDTEAEVEDPVLPSSPARVQRARLKRYRIRVPFKRRDSEADTTFGWRRLIRDKEKPKYLRNPEVFDFTTCDSLTMSRKGLNKCSPSPSKSSPPPSSTASPITTPRFSPATSIAPPPDALCQALRVLQLKISIERKRQNRLEYLCARFDRPLVEASKNSTTAPDMTRERTVKNALNKECLNLRLHVNSLKRVTETTRVRVKQMRAASRSAKRRKRELMRCRGSRQDVRLIFDSVGMLSNNTDLPKPALNVVRGIVARNNLSKRRMRAEWPKYWNACCEGTEDRVGLLERRLSGSLSAMFHAEDDAAKSRAIKKTENYIDQLGKCLLRNAKSDDGNCASRRFRSNVSRNGMAALWIILGSYVRVPAEQDRVEALLSLWRSELCGLLTELRSHGSKH
eukprot:g3576.t1